MVRLGAPGRVGEMNSVNWDIRGHFGTFRGRHGGTQARRHGVGTREEGTEARRHAGTEWGPGGKGESAADALSSLDASLPLSPLRGSVPQCLRAFGSSSPSVRLVG